MRGLAIILWVASVVAIPALQFLPSSQASAFVVQQFSRSIWNGVTVLDIVMPAFLVAMGASIAFSQVRRVERNEPASRRLMHILRRALLLFLLGILCSNSLDRHSAELRFAGPLQRLAICYFLGATLQAFVGVRGTAVASIVLLGNYWMVLGLWQVPGQTDGAYSMEGNVAAHVDKAFLPGRAYFGIWDPEGVLTTLPAIAVGLIGILLGRLLLKPNVSASRKSMLLTAFGVLAIGNGFALARVIPMNGYLWTPTFALISVGFVSIVIAFLHWRIVACGNSALVVPLTIAGRCALELAIAVSLIKFIGHFGGMPKVPFASTASASIYVVVVLAQILCIFALAWSLNRLRDVLHI